jgi:hypothetical protein
MRPASRRDLAGWYATALEAQRASGLSVAEYAARIGVAVPTLYQWRRRLEASAPCGEVGTQLIEVTEARPGSGLDHRDGDMVVRLSEGLRSVVVPRGFDGSELRRLIEVLESC